jgi:hypothetical protein
VLNPFLSTEDFIATLGGKHEGLHDLVEASAAAPGLSYTTHLDGVTSAHELWSALGDYQHSDVFVLLDLRHQSCERHRRVFLTAPFDASNTHKLYDISRC